MRYTDAAYRSSAARELRQQPAPGFQGALGNPSAPQQRFAPPPRPANDNWRRPPPAANDNGPRLWNRKTSPLPHWNKGLAKQVAKKIGKTIVHSLIPDPIEEVGNLGIDYARWYAGNAWPSTWPDPVGNVMPQNPPAGWLRFRCDPPRYVHGGPRSGTGSCLTLQAPPVAPAKVGDPYTLSAAQNYFHWANNYLAFGSVPRWRSVYIWGRNGQPGEVKGKMIAHRPFYAPWFVPGLLPWVDPMSTPLGLPSADPVAPPYRAIPAKRVNPYRSSTERSSWGPRTLRVEGVRLRPYQMAVGRVSVRVDARGVHQGPVRAAAHARMPPRRGEREAKPRFGGPLAHALHNALGKVTEAMDWVNALWWALPDEYRTKGFTNSLDKAKDIFLHLDKMRWDVAAKNIILMEIQDRVIGKISKTASSGPRKYGLDFGVTGLGRATKSPPDSIIKEINNL